MNITQFILLGVIIGLLVYDDVGPKNGQQTESQVLRDWGRNWKLLPFTAGFLLAHWFLNLAHPWARGWMYALPIMIAVLGVDVWWNLLSGRTDRPLWRWSGWYALAGIPVGMFLWGQAG